jgi:hypothetical protein
MTELNDSSYFWRQAATRIPSEFDFIRGYLPLII